MSDVISGIGQANQLFGSETTGMYAQAIMTKTASVNPSATNDGAEVTLSTTAQLQSLKFTGTGVNELAAEFSMPKSQVQDDLGMYPISTRTLIKSAPIADPNHPAKPQPVAKSDVSVQLSAAAQVQSMRETGASAAQIAAQLGMTVSEVSAELGVPDSAAQLTAVKGL